MASMELVELVPTAKVARELATQVAQCIIVHEGSTPACRERVQAFYDQCKAHVRHNDSPGFVSTVLTSAGVDLMACPKRRGECLCASSHRHVVATIAHVP